MIAPADDPGILLSAMGEYQDQQYVVTGDHAHPSMVCADWTFHEQRTGFDREKICHILPQLVAEALDEALGAGMVWGYRVSDGYAWITDRGQLQLAAWRRPSPPYQAELAALGPDAADRLHDLLAHAAVS